MTNCLKGFEVKHKKDEYKAWTYSWDKDDLKVTQKFKFINCQRSDFGKSEMKQDSFSYLYYFAWTNILKIYQELIDNLKFKILIKLICYLTLKWKVKIKIGYS